ncbi:MAG: hypothetical protein DI568_00095 [Sphingomonas sp.]|nr:MAG: hypothetical protein DI568_00095 [Sphingomonas sp.]
MACHAAAGGSIMKMAMAPTETADMARLTLRLAQLQRQLDELRAEQTRLLPNQDEPEIWAQRGNAHVRLMPRDIEWVESERDYVHLHNGERAYLLRATLTALHDRLGPNLFMRVRRSAIVRVECVESIRDRGQGHVHVALKSGAEVRVGRTYLKTLRERLRP